ncbi:MAG: hypothetical protein H6R19_553 [Proteobacteria bacterium]|nr:hypothetical protein [Pseudomonadota bacterium]
MSFSTVLSRTATALVLLGAMPMPFASAATETTDNGYNLPPRKILDVMRAPSLPVPSVSPTREKMLLVAWQEYPSLERVATPIVKLAGVRIEVKNHSRHDTPGGYGITPCAASYALVTIASGQQRAVALPPDACPGAPLWSADGKHFAFTNTAADAVELWVGDAATGKLRQMKGARLNPAFGDALQWLDNQTLLVKLLPKGLGLPPAATGTPVGPSIQEADGSKGQSSTYENRDTLSNKHDEDLFDHYAASQIATINIGTGTIRPIGKVANYLEVDSAPDGRHILVSAMHKPYSYVTTYDRFPREVQVWDAPAHGELTLHSVASLPLADRVPIQGVPTGPRDFAWRQNEPATLIWAEALDGGDWKVKVPARDKLLMQRAPFTAAPVEILRTEQRFGGFAWGERKDFSLMSEFDMNRHWQRSFIVNVDDPQQKPRLLWDLSYDEKYAAPGNPVMRRMANGALVIRQEGDAIYLAGKGASPDGDRPFLDRLSLATLKSERLFRSGKDAYEVFLAFTGADASSFLTWHQSPVDPPNAFMRTLGQSATAEAGEPAYVSTARALTHIPDPAPAVRSIKKQLVKYKRADGLDLSFTLYTPPGYKPGTRVPAILYAYPLDYANAASAGQVSGSEQTFTRLREYRLLLLAGYAIIDNASFPVVGDPKTAYDTYMDQLVADAKAAVDEAVKLGVVDPERIGVTGHSHGALMTANLIAHTRLFRAGVATSGSFNKTLTPFGFQSERRSLWEAPEVYQKVSPFFYADKFQAPLLIVHGADDANPGTTPLQATKLFEAIRGNGGTARLVMLPHEPHWYTARESNEQLIYEMVRWFDKYVKNAAPRPENSAQP